MLFNPAARLSTAVILLGHPGTSAGMAVWEFRTLAHLSSMAAPHVMISMVTVTRTTCSTTQARAKLLSGI